MTPPLPPIPVAFIILDGVDIPVAHSGGRMPVPDRSGELVTTWYNLAFTSEIEAETRRSWEFTTPPLPAAEWVALQPLLESGLFLDATGMSIDRTGATVVVRPKLGIVTHYRDRDVDIMYEVTFVLEEA